MWPLDVHSDNRRAHPATDAAERSEGGRMRPHDPPEIVHLAFLWVVLISVAALLFGCVASIPLESATSSATDQAAASDLVSPSVMIVPTATASMTMSPTDSPVASASSEAETIPESGPDSLADEFADQARPIDDQQPSTCVRATDYVVASGDTLSAIAKAHHLTLDALFTAKPQVTVADRIAIGDRLTILTAAPRDARRSTELGSGYRTDRGPRDSSAGRIRRRTISRMPSSGRMARWSTSARSVAAGAGRWRSTGRWRGIARSSPATSMRSFGRTAG